MREPRFLSPDEVDRRILAAKHARSAFLRDLAKNASQRFSTHTRLRRSLAASAAVSALAAGIFWLDLLSAPKVTEAGQPETSREQPTLR
jgi:hypothetical protein